MATYHVQARDHTKTENALLFRLAAKEQEVHEMKTQLHDLKQTKQAETAETHKLLLDPAVHREFVRLQVRVQLRYAPPMYTKSLLIKGFSFIPFGHTTFL
jgi:hypothetical protein